MLNSSSYQIRLSQFEGPFDLLLFFIERDELDIYNIPIHKLIKDFLDFIHSEETLNIELSSEFILFVSTNLIFDVIYLSVKYKFVDILHQC